MGDYVLVRCSEDGGNDTDPPEIAKVERVFPDGRLGVLWAYHPNHQDVPKEFEFGPYEILLSDHKDRVKVECLIGYADVSEDCEDCPRVPKWYWNKRYMAKQKKILLTGRTAKRRRTGA